MSVSIGEVLAEIRAAIEKLDAAAVTAVRAQTDVRDAQQLMLAVSRGADHADMTRASQDCATAVDKAGKVARLLSDSARHLAEYANVIAPNSLPVPKAADQAAVSGEDLLADTVKRSDSHKGIDSFLQRTARRIETYQERSENTTESAEKIVKIVRGPNGPGGGASTSEAGVPAPAPPARLDASDAVGNLVVVGLVAGIAARKSEQLIRRHVARWRNRGN